MNKATKDMIDKGYELDSQIKKMKKELDGIKDKLKAIASSQNIHSLCGNVATASVADITSTTVLSDKYHTIMLEKDRLDEFYDSISVSTTKAKKYLTDLDLEKVSVITTKPFDRISFKVK